MLVICWWDGVMVWAQSSSLHLSFNTKIFQITWSLHSTGWHFLQLRTDSQERKGWLGRDTPYRISWAQMSMPSLRSWLNVLARATQRNMSQLCKETTDWCEQNCSTRQLQSFDEGSHMYIHPYIQAFVLACKDSLFRKHSFEARQSDAFSSTMKKWFCSQKWRSN
jgi:hypothetical protein